MSPDEAGLPGSSPAERHVERELASLRDEQIIPSPELAPTIVRKARWQSAVRAPLRVASIIAVAVVEGVTGLFGGGTRA